MREDEKRSTRREVREHGRDVEFVHRKQVDGEPVEDSTQTEKAIVDRSNSASRRHEPYGNNVHDDDITFLTTDNVNASDEAPATLMRVGEKEYEAVRVDDQDSGLIAIQAQRRHA
jgi:hypothetical protein